MKIKCIANTGEKLLLSTLNNSGDSCQTKYSIKVGETYTVYGQNITNGILKYLIIGTYEKLPTWYPAELFELVDPALPIEWYYQYDVHSIVSAIWGYKELALNDTHYDALLEREPEAINIFLKRKNEIDQW